MPSNFPIQRSTAQWLAACLLAAGCAAANVHAADLSVTVKGLRSTQGNVLVGLFDSAESFPKGKPVGGQMAPAQGDGATVVFRNLPAGRYALTAFHDENGNGKLDFNMLGSPVEAVGFSRDAFGTAAAPVFDKAALQVDGDAAITVNLR